MSSHRFNPWRDLRGLPRDSWILALATLINRMGAMVLPFMTLHLTGNLGFKPARAGLALSAYGLASLIAAPLAGRLSDRFGAARVLELSLLSSGL
ncbi:MAG TPA: MFS transporter, partial [Myxococcaceae bacterium]|nr:MFS transporter [Myxococcaceae bacterium]